ncbi:hypothetical protein BG004_002080, partial [Podila humilis]
MAMKRLYKELRDIQENPSPLFTAHPASPDIDLFIWRAIIYGPEGTPFEGGHFPVSLHFPSVYPFKPPRVAFLVDIYHPGIDERSGGNCLDMLDSTGWSPAMTITKVLESLWMLLKEPSRDYPLMEHIGKVLTETPE